MIIRLLTFKKTFSLIPSKMYIKTKLFDKSDNSEELFFFIKRKNALYWVEYLKLLHFS
jgi:hypothetical protein